jgi:hypothetical protein
MGKSKDLRIRKIGVEVWTAFWDVYQIDLRPPEYGSDEWTLTVASTDYLGPGYATEGENGAKTFPSRSSKLTAARVEPLLHSIAGLEIPACPPLAWGFDGVTFTLKFDCGLNSAEYKWWCEVPDAWKPLGIIVDEIISLAEEPDWPRCLPREEQPGNSPSPRPTRDP